MVELEIKIQRDGEDSETLCASLTNDDNLLIAGYGKTPYEALRDLINEMEYQHQYFRAD